MSDQGEVLSELQGHVAILRLHRPARRNAISEHMLDALSAALADIERRGDVRCIVLLGSSGFFCAGADIAGYHGATAEQLERFTHKALGVVEGLRSSRVPVIAGVDGLALGGGLELVLATDIVVASTRASFGLPETSIGLIPGWRGTVALAESIGTRRAKHAILTGERISAARAEEWGLVASLVADGEADAAALDLAQSIAARAPLAIAAAKRSVDAADGATETRELLALFATTDGTEGVAAFVEKRLPVYRGS